MTFLLVHGAWCGAWAWDCLTPTLDELGISYKTIDLPGHGQNKRSMWSVSLADYANAVVDTANSINGPVIAVGHSMGGIVVSEAAAKAPSAFQALTYLAAFLPISGERLAFLAAKDKASKLNGGIKTHLLRGSSTLKEHCLDDALFNQCSAEDARMGKSLLGENPIRPILSSVNLNDQFDAIPKHYIRCMADQAITPSHQEWMANRYTLKSFHDIDSGHMAAHSAPKEVAEALVKIRSLESNIDKT